MLIKNNKKAFFEKENSTLRIALVVSEYYKEITQGMEKACFDFLVDSGVKKENIKSFSAPGSWEIPILIQSLAKTKKFDGIAALGLILKGETYHFEALANETAHALMKISLKYDIPVAYEILSVYSINQAIERSEGENNKGIEAGKALLLTIKNLKRIGGQK